jgi:nucleotide-binding universal stress UspA family protein
MIEITRILCPIDFSEFSRHALDHAVAIARWYNARLTVLYVFSNFSAIDMPAVVLDEKGRQGIMAEMRNFTEHVPSDLRLDLRIGEASDIHREILAQAQATHADLLVIGSHGRSGFERLLLGSVTERVIRKAPCPTMVVPRLAPDRSPNTPVQFRRILCSVDFSEGSLRALEYAVTLAEEADARLTVLHAIEVPPELREDPLAEGFDVDRVRAEAEARSLHHLRELIPQQARTYSTVETAVREGAAYHEILKVAAEQGVDLIVMGIQGRGALDLLLFGSNTARVTRTATCPVLIVPRV